MKRRDFLQVSALAGLGLSLAPIMKAASSKRPGVHSATFRKLCFDLLKDWCDGMMRVQVINASDSKVHGMLECPACEVVHARMMDAVYPFLCMARATGEQKYLDAGIAVFEWGENVSRPDGAWTNELNPDSWDGTTVFGAVALAEALHYHGDLLDEERRRRWRTRLEGAAKFVYQRFPSLDLANINYGATTIYALNLIGRVLGEPEYLRRSKALAAEIKAFFTEPNTLLFGEIKPPRNRLSAKGLRGVDLGYNVEESLNGIVLYALQEDDRELLQFAAKSLHSHLEFMLPDGGWDNGWGTRMFKWTYWGSRTSDGSQPAFGMMAGYNPAFGTAAVKYTELLRRCTADGLLHGGLHYVSHGIKPCVHHTFAHAKPLALMLDHWEHLPPINTSAPLPRSVADGVRYFEELDVSLFARGDWRGTVSAYDGEYDPKSDYRQATGGALSLLYHNRVGLLCAASMAVYKMVEVYNQQPAPGEDIALTPRVETYKGDVWYTNLFDLAGSYSASDADGEIRIVARARLKNEAREVVSGTASDFEVEYICRKGIMRIRAGTRQDVRERRTAFVLPIISSSGEAVDQPAPGVITLKKPEGTVRIASNVPLEIRKMPRSRTFNMVPGVEAVPVIAQFGRASSQVELGIEVDGDAPGHG